ncbi:MAG: cyclopropane-fatty-acyl-phospholipid synthase family protein [Gammaproteobacteria bacterium]|nr:cyclopropane-fatty-acyl-phospholipid synthase family protein [Gammaproteobacteria bacterium]
MSLLATTANQLAESGLIPDAVIRNGIRRLCTERKAEIGSRDRKDLDSFVQMMNESPIALVPDLANEQHYEVPAEFFDRVLGIHRKYSCCYWGGPVRNLDEAEEAALEITCQRAEIRDGMNVLDLGCGWGSLSLWIAGHYPRCTVTSVSNSSSQRQFIEQEAASLGLSNIRVITADMNEFSADQKYDRVVSVEMFEHMRNYGVLFERISNWLADDGLFFMHIFCHRSAAYEYIDRGPADWMSRHFFSGGIMPSGDLPSRFQQHLRLVEQWRWSGKQYQRTAEAWLQNMDARKADVMPILESTYGQENASRWWMRWRIFFLAVSEMFGMDDGREWGVGHYLFGLRPSGEQGANR